MAFRTNEDGKSTQNLQRIIAQKRSIFRLALNFSNCSYLSERKIDFGCITTTGCAEYRNLKMDNFSVNSQNYAYF